MSQQGAAKLPDLAREQPEREHDAQQHHEADQTNQPGVVIVDNPIVHDAPECVPHRI